MRRGVRKRRFGVSIPEELTEKLEKLSEALQTDRSTLVSEALKEYLHDHAHYLTPHECGGVMILLGDTDSSNLTELLREYHDIICGYAHLHADNNCVNIIVVSGSSSRIARLHSKLLKTCCGTVRFIPSCYFRPVRAES